VARPPLRYQRTETSIPKNITNERYPRVTPTTATRSVHISIAIARFETPEWREEETETEGGGGNETCPKGKRSVSELDRRNTFSNAVIFCAIEHVIKSSNVTCGDRHKNTFTNIKLLPICATHNHTSKVFLAANNHQ